MSPPVISHSWNVCQGGNMWTILDTSARSTFVTPPPPEAVTQRSGCNSKSQSWSFFLTWVIVSVIYGCGNINGICCNAGHECGGRHAGPCSIEKIIAALSLSFTEGFHGATRWSISDTTAGLLKLYKLHNKEGAVDTIAGIRLDPKRNLDHR
jgi:hypothetical protein